MTWGYVQGNKTAATATALSSVACTYVTANVSAGTSLVAHVTTSTQTGTTDTVATVKDGAGNNFLRIMHIAGGSPNILNDVSVWILNTPAGDVGTKPTITATLSGGTANMGILIQEWSGLAVGATLALLVDGTGGTLTGTATGATGSPTYSSTASNELLLKIYGDSGGPLTYTAPSGTADANNVNSSGNADLAVVYGNSTGGAESGSWSLAGTSTQWGVILVALKLASTSVTGTFSLALAPKGLALSGTATPPAISGTFSLKLAARALAFAAPVPVTGTFSLALAARQLEFAPAGPLILVMAARAGTDDDGNTFVEGFTAGAPGGQQAILGLSGTDGIVVFPSGSPDEEQAAGLAAHLLTSGTTFLQLLMAGAAVLANTEQVFFEFNSANTDGSGNASLQIIYRDGSGGFHGYAFMDPTGFNIPAGSITAAHPGTTPAVAESWQSLGTGTGATWFINEARYRLTAEGELEIDIALNAQTGGGSAGTFAFTTTLPAAYQFAGNYSRSYPMGYNGTLTSGGNSGCVLVDGAGTATAGRVRVQLPALPATTNLCVTVRIPLS